MKPYYQLHDTTLTLFLHLQPGAKKSEFCGLHGERLKIRIKAPPVDGKANEELIRFLAEALSVTKSQIAITSGELGREKTVKVYNINALPQQLSCLS